LAGPLSADLSSLRETRETEAQRLKAGFI